MKCSLSVFHLFLWYKDNQIMMKSYKQLKDDTCLLSQYNQVTNALNNTEILNDCGGPGLTDTQITFRCSWPASWLASQLFFFCLNKWRIGKTKLCLHVCSLRRNDITIEKLISESNTEFPDLESPSWALFPLLWAITAPTAIAIILLIPKLK